MTKQKLNASGHLVQHAYLVQCLRLVHEFGALRVLTIAYAMFPTRTQTAASAAAKRVVSNALKLEYLACHIEPDSRRYYALTLRGARVLHSADDSYRVRSTTNALVFHRHEHREWCNVVALAARHLGLNSLSEAQIVGAAHSEIVSIFGHVPDAVTYYDDNGKPCAAWHEVELSRRSVSGTKKLRHLVHTLIEKRYLIHDGREHNINLVLHCATAKIERENHRVIESVLAAYDVLEPGEDAKAAAVYASAAAEAAKAAAIEAAEAAAAAEVAEASGDPEATYATEVAAAFAKEAADAAAAEATEAAKVVSAAAAFAAVAPKEKAATAAAATNIYTAQIGTGDAQRSFHVRINRLPTEVGQVWQSSLPWPGAPGEVASGVDVFLEPCSCSDYVIKKL